MLSQPNNQPPREPLQGKRLLSALRARGIEADNVTRNRRTGVYTIKFAAPEMNNFYSRGTDSAKVWAERIEAAFSNVRIIDTYDSAAEWRPNQPILFATVFAIIDGDLQPQSPQPQWYYAFGIDDWPQRMTAEEATNYTGPFETELEALKALVKEYQGRIEALEAWCSAYRALSSEEMTLSDGLS